MWGGHSCPTTLTMSKKPVHCDGLKGVRILVGRARHQAGSLSAELRKLGATVIEIPFIEIRKPRSFRPLDAALKNLSSYDWLILTSVNGVEAMWERMAKLRLNWQQAGQRADSGGSGLMANREGHEFTYAGPSIGRKPASAAESPLRIAAIGPATKRAIEKHGAQVDVVPEEYVAESVVRSLKSKVKGKRVLLVRAKVARDVIPRELRSVAHTVDVVEAYETVVPQSSRARLLAALKNPRRRPHVITFTSSSTVRNFVALLGSGRNTYSTVLDGIRTASIGPVTSSTLRELRLPVDIAAKEFTIPGLVHAIVRSVGWLKK
jgi:uroporphyrinogen-III synthase